MNRRNGLHEIFDATYRREQVARKLGCRPETIALLSTLTAAACEVSQAQATYRNARFYPAHS